MELTDTPSWTRNPDIQKAFSNFTQESFDKASPRDGVMALTNDGWRISGDM